MAKIKVPVELLQEHAKTLIDIADENEDIFDRIQNSLLMLENDGNWKGVSFDAAVEATRKNQAKFSEVVNDLHKLASFLKRFSDEIADTDESLRTRINSI